ncbi:MULTISPECIES: hypothetical protein [unclassified Trichocoleus]|nr:MULTISPECIES: hypothetical protein [unclassified Trichocoleus]
MAKTKEPRYKYSTLLRNAIEAIAIKENQEDWLVINVIVQFFSG